MGFRLTDNFNRPFASKSVTEIWTRWHITLSSWMRDYVYFPLVLNKKFQGTWVILCAVMISFTLIGLWHGADWTFIIVGILHGSAICYETLTRKIRNKLFKNIPERLYGALCNFCMFFYLCFSLIFFRAQNVSDAFYIVKNLFVNITFSKPIIVGLNQYEFTIAVIAILVMEGVQFIQKQNKLAALFFASPQFARWSLYYALFFAIVLLGNFNLTPFVYFQF
jgi:D-alanyl-lipoteichoic acid acyltransferase DltB (MBOAT superfamily)